MVEDLFFHVGEEVMVYLWWLVKKAMVDDVRVGRKGRHGKVLVFKGN